jgi:hypothetical protein
MKTMIVFHLPQGQLLYCDLADLALTPALRSTYQFDGAEYEVERPRELLTRKGDGSRAPTSEQLLDLMIAVAPPEQPLAALAMIASMRNIGDNILPHTDGGILLPLGAKKLIEDVDRLVVLTMRHIGDVPKVDRAAMLRAIHQHL